jgi:aldehyde dehydrogenase (NAD+)
MTTLEALPSVTDEASSLIAALGVSRDLVAGGALEVQSPITGEVIARVKQADAAGVESAIAASNEAFRIWRKVPAPKRGELVHLLGEKLRGAKTALGRLVTIETGKIVSEGLGEVQEMIDICDFAVGLSRQLHGLTIASERPDHRMMETWHPLGITGIITAFNFPVAVWSWNAALALVCGDSLVWKPSEKTSLSALAVQALFERAAASICDVPANLSTVLIGGPAIGELIVDHPKVPLISATGSTAMGRAVGPRLSARFARSILELGGNNAAIICPSADLDLALRAIAFAAMGTAGQRCTSLRRLIVHESVYPQLIDRLKHTYVSVAVGDPRAVGTLVGPLIDATAYEKMKRALAEARAAGGLVTGGERIAVGGYDGAFYVSPAMVEMPSQGELVKRETFAPILYVMKFRDFEHAIALHNDVPQGLSSSIFTNDLREAEHFLGSEGSDCGIANVNIGPSGAEIGGAFGGEKETGGGREAGSDAWKAYMRRTTNAINYGQTLPLAQGVKFEVA